MKTAKTIVTGALLLFPILQSSASGAEPTIESYQYLDHWIAGNDPWADITVTVTPPDDEIALPANATVELDTVYVLGTRKDLFCHIEEYFYYSLVTRIDGGSWNDVASKNGTTTGCPSGSQPKHAVGFDLEMTDGDHTLEFHIYSDGRSGFCPRPNANSRSSMKVGGTLTWTSAAGQLETVSVTIDGFEQPRNLSGCPTANTQTSKFPVRVIPRSSDSAPVPLVVWADSSPRLITNVTFPVTSCATKVCDQNRCVVRYCRPRCRPCCRCRFGCWRW